MKIVKKVARSVLFFVIFVSLSMPVHAAPESDHVSELKYIVNNDANALIGHLAKLSKGFIGIGVSFSISTAVRSPNDVNLPYVHRVIKNSPAAKAGLKSGDVILKINNKEVSSENEFINEVSSAASNNSYLNLVVSRAKDETVFNVFLKPGLIQIPEHKQQEMKNLGAAISAGANAFITKFVGVAKLLDEIEARRPLKEEDFAEIDKLLDEFDRWRDTKLDEIENLLD